jgi:hypothetical protein
VERDIIERRIVHQLGRVKIEVQRIADYDGDYDWLGEFCSYDSKHTPQNENQKLVHRDSGLVLDHYGIWRDKRGRIAPEPETRQHSREYQFTFHNNGHEKIAYALQDNKRLEDLERGYWCFLGVRAVVTFAGRTIGEASVWGVESDSGESYFAEIERDEIYEAMAEAKKFRKALVK